MSDRIRPTCCGRVLERRMSKRVPTKEECLQELETLRQRLSEFEHASKTQGQWEAIFQAIGHPTVILDLHHSIISANKAMERCLGKTSRELQGLKCWEIFHGPGCSEPPAQCPFERMAASGMCETVEMEMEVLGGTYLVSCTPMLDDEGRLENVIHIATDVTERKRAEEAHRSESEFNTLVIENASQGICVCYAIDEFPYVRFKIWNERMTLITGYSMEEINRLGWYQSLYPDPVVQQRAVDRMQRMRIGDNIQDEEWRIVRADGQERDMLIATRLYAGSKGENYVLGVMHDITERKQAEERQGKMEAQLLQAQKMESVGHLAGGVAHDFNNLLQGILGYLELALDKLSPDDRRFRYLTEAQKAGKSAANLTRQLLAFGRRQILNPEALDLNSVIEDFMRMVRQVIGEHIELNIIPGDALATIRADRSQIEQILMNLCVNARDAMLDGGRLIIETANATLDAEYCAMHQGAMPGCYVTLSVTDSGCGMTPETIQQIFEPFFTTKEKGRGTGLGLSTVYGIVHQHEGFVQVYSEPGKGSTFKMYLPAFEHVAVAEKHATATPVRGGGGETILLAEDDERGRHLAECILEEAGYKVIAAADGEEALRLYIEHRQTIDLLLLDVVMPKKSGRAVMEEIHAERPDMPCLFCSGYSENAVHTNFVLEKGLHFLQKPYRREDLLRAVRQILDGSSPS